MLTAAKRLVCGPHPLFASVSYFIPMHRDLLATADLPLCPHIRATGLIVSDRTSVQVHAHNHAHTPNSASNSKHVNSGLFDQRHCSCVCKMRVVCVCVRVCGRGTVYTRGPAVQCFSIEVLSDGQQETQTM